MQLVAGLGQKGYRHYFFQISDHDLIAFFEWPDVGPVAPKEHGRPVRGPFIFDHVSFGVETEDELWELKSKLEAAGLNVSDVIDHGFIHSIYAHDPNGIPIEFSHNVEGNRYSKGSSDEGSIPIRGHSRGCRATGRNMAGGRKAYSFLRAGCVPWCRERAFPRQEALI